MATPQARSAVASARGGRVSQATASEARAAAVAETNVLDDPEKQAAILDPSPDFTTIGGKEVKLHKLASRYSRMLTSLATTVYAKAAGRSIAADTAAAVRILSVLNGPEGDGFYPLLALSLHERGSLSYDAAVFQGNEIAEAIEYGEMAQAWMKMLALNDTVGMITASLRSASTPRP